MDSTVGSGFLGLKQQNLPLDLPPLGVEDVSSPLIASKLKSSSFKFGWLRVGWILWMPVWVGRPYQLSVFDFQYLKVITRLYSKCVFLNPKHI